MKPKVEGESNRKGVYFINNDTADNFEIPEPSSQATNIPIRGSETYVIDGNTVNTYTSPSTGKKILFKIKLVDDSIVKNGIEILPGGNLSEFRAKNITDDQLKAVIIDSIKPGMIKKTAHEAYKKQVYPVTPAPAQQTSEVESLEMEGAAQLQLDLQFELEADLTDVNVALEVYWEGQIEPFPEKKAKLREQKLYPFSKMIKAFNEGTYIPTDEMTSE